ncbi:MAG: hypothetical protein HN413_14340 [Chloroflexi bacterium]|jgi:hypothetical protein|nr:hypothetical protein [Chloroflexota bacterium]
MNKAMQLKAQIRNFPRESGVPAQTVLQNLMLERLKQAFSIAPARHPDAGALGQFRLSGILFSKCGIVSLIT